VLKAKQANVEMLEHLGNKVLQGHLVKLGRLVKLETLVTWDRQGLLVHLVSEVKVDPLELLVLKVYKEKWVHQDHQDQLAHLDLGDQLER